MKKIIAATAKKKSNRKKPPTTPPMIAPLVAEFWEFAEHELLKKSQGSAKNIRDFSENNHK